MIKMYDTHGPTCYEECKHYVLQMWTHKNKTFFKRQNDARLHHLRVTVKSLQLPYGIEEPTRVSEQGHTSRRLLSTTCGRPERMEARKKSITPQVTTEL